MLSRSELQNFLRPMIRGSLVHWMTWYKFWCESETTASTSPVLIFSAFGAGTASILPNSGLRSILSRTVDRSGTPTVKHTCLGGGGVWFPGCVKHILKGTFGCSRITLRSSSTSVVLSTCCCVTMLTISILSFRSCHLWVVFFSCWSPKHRTRNCVAACGSGCFTKHALTAALGFASIILVALQGRPSSFWSVLWTLFQQVTWTMCTYSHTVLRCCCLWVLFLLPTIGTTLPPVPDKDMTHVVAAAWLLNWGCSQSRWRILMVPKWNWKCSKTSNQSILIIVYLHFYNVQMLSIWLVFEWNSVSEREGKWHAWSDKKIKNKVQITHSVLFVSLHSMAFINLMNWK